MGFVLSQSKTYKWPVVIKVPAPEGKYTEFDFVGEFNRLPQSRIDEISKNLRDQAGRPGQEGDITDDLLVDEVFAGWSCITDESGNVLQVTPDNRAQLLETPKMKAAIIAAFFEVVYGIERKNS